jgi:hypothetical protein
MKTLTELQGDNQYFKSTKNHLLHNMLLDPRRMEKYAQKIDLDIYLPTKNKFLQRGLDWTDTMKQGLVWSIIRKHPIPPVTLVDNDSDNTRKPLLLLDGKQRYTTIVGFVNDEFPIQIDGVDTLFSELHPTVQQHIRAFEFQCISLTTTIGHETITDEALIQEFLRINVDYTPQSLEHIESLMG